MRMSVKATATALAARMATYFPWYESDDCVIRQAAIDSRTAGCTHDCLYIAGIPLLAHGLTVKLSPSLYSLSSPAGRIVVHACLCGI